MSTLQDYSGNGHTAIPYANANGLVGGTFDGISCVFDGGSYLQIPATVASAVSGISSFTFAAWIKVASFNNYRYFHMGSDASSTCLKKLHKSLIMTASTFI